MDFPIEAEERMVQLFNIYSDLNRKPYEYSPGIWLYPSEVHAVEHLSHLQSRCRLSDLSTALGLTKGAISKMSMKLEKLGLVRRYKYLTNQKEVYLELTDTGHQVAESHSAYHQQMRMALKTYFDQLSTEKCEEIFSFISLYHEQMEGLKRLKRVDEVGSSKKAAKE